MALPIPLLAPVTTAILSVNVFRFCSNLVLVKAQSYGRTDEPLVEGIADHGKLRASALGFRASGGIAVLSACLRPAGP